MARACLPRLQKETPWNSCPKKASTARRMPEGEEATQRPLEELAGCFLEGEEAELLRGARRCLVPGVWGLARRVLRVSSINLYIGRTGALRRSPLV